MEIIDKGNLKKITAEMKTYIDNTSSRPVVTPTSATKFTISRGVITSYIGTDAEVVIPKTYSIEKIIPINGAELSQTMPTTGSFPSLPDNSLQLTFTDGTNTATAQIGYPIYDWATLQTWFASNFTGTPLLVSSENSQWSLITLCYADDVGNAFIKFPVMCNGRMFDTASELATYCGTLSSPYTLSFAGQYEIIIDGTDYNITSISANAFKGKTILKSVKILDNITSIGASAFQGATNLESVIFEKNSLLTEIKNLAFEGCSKLEKVKLPESLRIIGTQAFGNNVFKELYIPKNVTSISNGAFRPSNVANMLRITKIEVDPENTTYDSRNDCNCIIETSTNKIIQGCNTSTIPNTVATIGAYAFAYCNIYKSLTIPNSVTTIYDNAFSYSTLTSVSTSAQTIENFAFAYCRDLTSLTLRNGVTTIRQYTFSYCTSLTSLTIPNTVTSIGYGAFQYCTALTSITFSTQAAITEIGNYAFSYCRGLTTINVPASVGSLGRNAFQYCTSLQTANLYFSSSTTKCTSASAAWFYGCNSSLQLHIKSISTPADVFGTYWNYYSSSGTLTVTKDL